MAQWVCRGLKAGPRRLAGLVTIHMCLDGDKFGRVAAAPYTELMTTGGGPPTITMKAHPRYHDSGQPFTLEWSSSNATSVSRVCSSTVSGYVVNEQLAPSGKVSGTALPGWVGYDSTCKWTARTSAASSAETVELMQTRAALSVSNSAAISCIQSALSAYRYT